MKSPQSRAESQEEQIRVAELVIQQLRTAGTSTNPPPPTRGTFQKEVTEGGAFKALTKYVGNPSEYHDWAFTARRVLTRADERLAGLLQWISGTIGEKKESDVLEYRRTPDLSTVDMDWLNSEPYVLLALETTDAALASIESLEEAEAQGIIGCQRLEREARGYHNHRVSLLTESVTHPERAEGRRSPTSVLSVGNLKVFQRGRPTGLDDDVKANAMRHMMPKEILDAVNLQPQYHTFVEIRDYTLQQARQRAEVFVRDVCPATQKIVTTPSLVSASTNNPTATKNTPVPMDVSQMSSNVAKSETEEQESGSYQYEQDQDGDGDELFAVKGNGKGGFKGTCFKCGMRGHKADRRWQKGTDKGGKGDWEKGKGGSKGK